jgi:preprotein translocase subunit SecF
MIEIVPPKTNIDFIKLRKPAIAISLVVIAIGRASLIMKGGPNYGIDFAGGLQFHMRANPDVTISDVREAVEDLGIGDVSVQAFESQKGEYLLRVATAQDEDLSGGVAAKLKDRLREKFGERGFEELRTELVGPRVGQDLRRRAILAVTFSTLAMGVYIALRFDRRFGIGAAIALFHDVLVTVGALSLLDYEFDLTIIAALLTIVGYSVNDTVVISDRIRENMKATKRAELGAIINRSINETLSRTILTTGATMLVVVSLFLVGGTVIHGFAFALIVGFVSGVYSTVFIAAPLVDWLEPQRSVAA